jgi:CelD/BcsL family acetyltransferase involved in cellulose biosynthesis
MSVRLSRSDLAGFGEIASDWDRLAAGGGSPFLTAAWLSSWWRAFAPERASALVLRADDESILAGGLFLETDGALRAAVNDHTNDWGIVAEDDEARACFWAEVARLGRRRVALEPLLDEADAVRTPRRALEEAGYRLAEETLEPSPWLELPDSFDDLLAGRSRNLRSQVGRRRRALEREGELTLRVVKGGPTLGGDLDAFFALEAGGWKGRSGTAIAADADLVELYRGFAESAAAHGWLRLYMLELNDRLVAADYGCVFEGCGYLIKTSFDEELGRFAPGLVLRAGVLGASIDEGLQRYDFLGGPDEYKLRWADRLRGRTALHAFRGAGAVHAYAWRKRIRPALRGARDRARGGLESIRRRR